MKKKKKLAEIQKEVGVNYQIIINLFSDGDVDVTTNITNEDLMMHTALKAFALFFQEKLIGKTGPNIN